MIELGDDFRKRRILSSRSIMVDTGPKCVTASR
jgi:hypothetical protein